MEILMSKASSALARRADNESLASEISEEALDLGHLVLGTKTPVLPPAVSRRAVLPLHVYDRTEDGACATMTANAPIPFEVDNAMVTGQAILKVRSNNKDDHYAPYFANRQRMLEIMIQGKIKDVGSDDFVYIGIQTADKIKLSGFFTKAAAKIVLGLISNTVPHAHCTLGNERETAQLVFPLDLCVDRLAVTKPGEEPPALGVDMLPEEYSRERRPPLRCFDMESTYTFSLHTMYVDLVSWKLVNLPGLGTVPLDTFIKGQPLYFVGYALPRNHRGPHLEKDKKYLFKFELENDHRGKH